MHLLFTFFFLIFNIHAEAQKAAVSKKDNPKVTVNHGMGVTKNMIDDMSDEQYKNTAPISPVTSKYKLFKKKPCQSTKPTPPVNKLHNLVKSSSSGDQYKNKFDYKYMSSKSQKKQEKTRENSLLWKK